MNVWKGGAAAVERPHVWSEDQQMGTSIYPVSGIECDGLRSAVAFGGDS